MSEKKRSQTAEKTRKIIISALFAALCCVATMVIQIPSPTNGYVNLGDCFVLLSGFVLGPVYGTLAAGVGSALADLLSGYAYYAPGTFVIKAAVAIVACLIFKALFAAGKYKILMRIIASLCGEIVMVIGYFGYAALILGNGFSALSGVPSNLVQAAAGIIGAVLLAEVFDRVHIAENFIK